MAAPVPIYVIALEHTHARRKAISERLGAHGLSFNFIKAVNGKNLAEDEIDNFTTFTRQKYLPYPLSKGAIGAGLSHLDAWRIIAASDAPMALILEDDAILDKDLDDILHQLSLLEDRIDIVNLHNRPAFRSDALVAQNPAPVKPYKHIFYQMPSLSCHDSRNKKTVEWHRFNKQKPGV